MEAEKVGAEERFALVKIFEGDSVFSWFLEQWLPSAVIVRENTGVGFFATITFSEKLPHGEQKQWDWNFDHRALAHGGSFICWRDGDCVLELEAVSHFGEWPTRFDPSDFTAS